MKTKIFLLSLLISLSPAVLGETVQRSIAVEHESEVFVRMGDVVVTQADFDAFFERRRPEDVVGVVSSRETLETVLDILLTDRLVAAAGIESGLLQDDQIRAGLLDSFYLYLSGQQMQRYLAEQELDDYSQHARELWLTGTRPEHPARYDFSHLLISSHNRSDAEAARLVLELSDQIGEGADFSALIQAHSEDPSLSDNQGRFAGITLESLEPEVAEALEGLEPGDIAAPVRSRHGWHIVRLDDYREAAEMSYEEAQPRLESMARSRHRQRVRESYLTTLGQAPLEVADGAVERLQERYGAR